MRNSAQITAIGIAMAMALSSCHSGPTDVSLGVKRVEVEDFARLWEERGYVLLDVRTPGEFSAGHIPGARNLDIHSASFESEVNRLDPAAGYLVYCRSGRRSQRACELMSAAGFEELYELKPGFNGWQAAGQAVER